MQPTASIEEGRVPLAQPAVAEELAAAIRKTGRLHFVLWLAVLFDFILAPLLLLSPFSFSLSAWFTDQVAGWTLEESVADWGVVVFIRDILAVVALIRGRQREHHEAASRSARRIAVVTLLLGIDRMVMIDWQGPSASVCVPTAVFAAIVTTAQSLLAHCWLQSSRRVQKLRSASENAEGAENSDDTSQSQYSSALTFFQTLMVLKPYFWPSTGEREQVAMNRFCALLTWVCVAGSKAANLVAPICLAHAINGVTAALNEGAGAHLTSQVATSLVMYAFLSFLSKALKELQSLVYIRVQQAAYVEIADRTFAHLHNMSLDWHLRKKMGNVIRSMDRGIQAAQQTMQYVCLYLMPTLVEAVVVNLIFAFHFKNLRLAVFIFLDLYLYAYLTVKVTLWRKSFRTATTKHDNELHDRLTDSLVNFETIKYFTAEEYERREYRGVVQKFQSTSMKTQASLSVLNVLQQIVINVALAGGMLLATARVLREHGQLGDVVAVSQYIMNVFVPLSFLGTIYNMVVNALVDMHSFTQLLAEKSDVQDQAGAPDIDLVPKPGVPMVEFRNVSFNYSKQPLGRSIQDINFQTARGATTALVGVTGAGKTTVTRLLFRFYDPVVGQVLVNGQDARGVTQRSLRAAIGMVPQDVVMFNASIAHNIRYGRIDHATQAEIEKAAEMAQLDTFVHEQPNGYETAVGERGLKLSGGEKQRLAIARCFVKDPPIVVLDEATSALDSQTEVRIQQAFEALSNSRTVIAIAHRLSTIRHFDQILVLESGQVVERGTHSELLAQDGSRYAQMWNRQAAGISDDTSPSSGGGGATEEPAAGLGMASSKH